MKIAVIGAGSYVFGPSVLAQTYLEQRLANVELALVDPDLETIELVAGVGRRMARENGLATVITTHPDRPAALDGADFVICSASPQMQRRNAMDWAIIDQFLPGHLKTEFGGIAGISYSLRQIALIEAIAGDMGRLCPNAWLLNVSNPLPRVAQAAHENGIKTAGFCVASISAYAMLWDIFQGEWISYPFTQAREKWQVTSAGLNHFAWVLDFRERSTGADLMPALRDLVSNGDISKANPRAQRYLGETGYLLVPGDDHTRDFLPPLGPVAGDAEKPWHGNPRQRQDRLELLRLVGEGSRPWDDLLIGEAWEKPLQFISALSGGPPAHFHSMNLINQARQVANLPNHVFVETPCDVAAGHVKPVCVTLPEIVLPLCQQTANVTNTIVRAARNRSRTEVHKAVELDPTVLDKAAGIQAIDACLAAHADILPAYS